MCAFGVRVCVNAHACVYVYVYVYVCVCVCVCVQMMHPETQPVEGTKCQAF